MKGSEFQSITVVSLVGIGSILWLQFFKAHSDNTLWAQTEGAKAQLQAQTNFQEAQVQAAKQVADAYAKNQIANFDQLIVQGYTFTDNADPPKVNWQRSLHPDRKTFIYSQDKVCVGYAHKGQFYFIRYYPGACQP